MLKIWGNDHSSCTQKVTWCAAELGLPFELIVAGGEHGGLETEAYGRLNPNRVIPTIDDGGLVLWESGAILCHLAATHGAGRLLPEEPRARAEAFRWVFWQGTTVRPSIMPLYMQWEVWKPAYRHLEELERLRLGMEAKWRIVEGQLAGRDFLAGDRFTIADVAMGIMAHWWYRFPIDHFELPAMRAWHARLLDRPAFQANVVQPMRRVAETGH